MIPYSKDLAVFIFFSTTCFYCGDSDQKTLLHIQNPFYTEVSQHWSSQSLNGSDGDQMTESIGTSRPLETCEYVISHILMSEGPSAILAFPHLHISSFSQPRTNLQQHHSEAALSSHPPLSSQSLKFSTSSTSSSFLSLLLLFLQLPLVAASS